MFLLTQGIDRIAAMIQQGVDAARQAERIIADSPDFTVVTPASLGIVTFAPTAPSLRERDAIHAAVKALLADGHALIIRTELDGKTVFRLCPIHPGTTEEDMRSSLERLASILEACQP